MPESALGGLEVNSTQGSHESLADFGVAQTGGYGGGSAMERYSGAVDRQSPVRGTLDMPAERAETDSSSVGEFQVCRSKTPGETPAQSSALVPMFSKRLGDARTILIDHEREMPKHPFHAVRLAPHSLELGVVVLKQRAGPSRRGW